MRKMLDLSTGLQLPVGFTKIAYKEEVSRLIKSYSIIEEARQDFLDCKLTFEQYLELLEMHDFNIDQYLKTVEDNLEQRKLI